VPCAIGTGYGTSREERKETVMTTTYIIKVRKGKTDTDPLKQHITSGDEVIWTIDSIEDDEALVAKSTDGHLPFNEKGKKKEKKLNKPFTYTRPVILGTTTHDVPYSISVDNGTETLVSSGYLVIDTIGMPTAGGPGGHGGEPGGSGHGQGGHGHEGGD
jgi:hypothetical protein